MTRRPRARRPLSTAERAALEPALLHLLREARRPDYTVYTNRADFAQAFGILEGLVKVGLLTDRQAQEWRHRLEDKAERTPAQPREPQALPYQVRLQTPQLALEEAVRRAMKLRPDPPARRTLSWIRYQDAVMHALFDLIAEERKARETEQ